MMGRLREGVIRKSEDLPESKGHASWTDGMAMIRITRESRINASIGPGFCFFRTGNDEVDYAHFHPLRLRPFPAVPSLCLPAQAGDSPEAEGQAVVLAAFGTTVAEALPGILNIRDRIQRQFPQTPVKIAFTSDLIRKVWQRRRSDDAFIKDNPGVPADIYTVQGPLATIANLQDQGYRTIIVQPGHISLGEEYCDLVAVIDGLNSIRTVKPKFRPFEKLVVGRPAMGTSGEQHPYSDDLTLIAKALADDAALAEKNKAALLYMAHGNSYMPSGGAYLEFAAIMNRLYPQVKTYIALVEGYPSLDDTLPLLEQRRGQEGAAQTVHDRRRRPCRQRHGRG